MPRFGESDLSEHDVDSIARYLEWVRDNGDEGRLPARDGSERSPKA